MTSRLLLQLSLPSDWEQIEVVRQAVALCVGAVFGEASTRDAIAMVSSELLENGIKHGLPAAPVRLSLEESAEVFSVVVTNSVASSSNTAALVDRIAWLKSFATPREAYTAAMMKSLEEMTEGGLGLPRIAHEGGCAVTCDVSAPGEVSVCARLAASGAESAR